MVTGFSHSFVGATPHVYQNETGERPAYCGSCQGKPERRALLGTKARRSTQAEPCSALRLLARRPHHGFYSRSRVSVGAWVLLRRTVEAWFEVTAKVGRAGVAQGRRDLFVGKTLGQQRRRQAHSRAPDPGLGRGTELRAETPLQRAHVQPEVRRQSFDAESFLPDCHLWSSVRRRCALTPIIRSIPPRSFTHRQKIFWAWPPRFTCGSSR